MDVETTGRDPKMSDLVEIGAVRIKNGRVADRWSTLVNPGRAVIGAQMDVQRIPMVFYSSGMKHLVRGTPFRLVDIMPTVLRTMGIPPTAPMDGTAYNLTSN